jgi:hypothetical protein
MRAEKFIRIIQEKSDEEVENAMGLTEDEINKLLQEEGQVCGSNYNNNII